MPDAPLRTFKYPALLPAAIGASLLLIAIAPLPYGFYVFLRVAITVISIVVAVISVRSQKSGWIFGAAPIAILWNPIFPVYLSRQAWAPLDILAALVLLICGLGIRLPLGAASKKQA